MALDFAGLLAQGEAMGVLNILLPFVLVFAIAFAVLEKIQIFGAQKRNINIVIALVLGILFIRNQYLVGLINRFLPNVSMFMIIILMFLLLIGIFMGEHKNWSSNLLTLAMVVSLIFIVWSLSSDYIGSRWEIPSWLYGLDETTKAGIIFIGIFVVVIRFITKEPKGPGDENWLEKLKKGVGGSN